MESAPFYWYLGFVCSIAKHTMHYFLLLSDSFLLLLYGITQVFSWKEYSAIPSNAAAILLRLYSCFLFLFFIQKVLTPSAESCIVFGMCLLFLISNSCMFIYMLKGYGLLDTDTKSMLLVIWLFIWWVVASFLHIKKYARITSFGLLLYKIGGYVMLGFQLACYSDVLSNILPIAVIIGLTLILLGIILYLDWF